MKKNYTMYQSEEEQYKSFEQFMFYIDEKIYNTKMSFFRAVETEIIAGGYQLDIDTESPQDIKRKAEEYFWSIGFPFEKIENYSKWFAEQARCRTLVGVV